MDGDLEIGATDETTGSASRLDRATAFAALAEHHLDEAYRLARLIVGDAAEAEDATHDAFVAAWRGWGGLRDPLRFDAWFGRILINTCRGRARRMRRRTIVDVGVLETLPDRSGDPGASFLDQAEIGPAFAGLSLEHREVLALRYYLDLPVDQIAGRLGIPVGTAKSRLHYALRLLAAALESERREVDR
jgi:RNA polymerase sigma-70 factor, ECF subfamily